MVGNMMSGKQARRWTVPESFTSDPQALDKDLTGMTRLLKPQISPQMTHLLQQAILPNPKQSTSCRTNIQIYEPMVHNLIQFPLPYSTWLDIRSAKRRATGGSARASVMINRRERLPCRVGWTFWCGPDMQREKQSSISPLPCPREWIYVSAAVAAVLCDMKHQLLQLQYGRKRPLSRNPSEFSAGLELVRLPVLLTEPHCVFSL